MHLSYFDGLTGIANRRYFEDIAGREWRRAAREESPISLMMVDIDFFKNYNDMYGHLAGDECLQKVAKTLKEHLKRPGDMVARYGGEEFVILLPDTDAKNATTLAEGLRRRIEKLGIEHAESFVSDVVTISLGVACVLPNENISLSVLISNADRALYRAKKAGRNRVGTVDLMTPATQSK
jgi:diguanylate cyclase (GGDEF)-like protein